MQLAVLYHQRRRAADQIPEPHAAQADGTEQRGQGDQRDNGDHPVEQRQGEVLHGNGGQIGDQQRQHQLDGLQLADLPLAADAQSGDQQQIEDQGTEKRGGHGSTSFRSCIPKQYVPAAGKLCRGTAAQPLCI